MCTFDGFIMLVRGTSHGVSSIVFGLLGCVLGTLMRVRTDRLASVDPAHSPFLRCQRFVLLAGVIGT